jgi:xylan 1,4-beta-xylosidase
MSCEGDVPKGRLTFQLPPVALEAGPVRLRASVDRAKLQFAYAVGEMWSDVGPPLDASLISDEAGAGEHGSFTGAFIGLAAFDTSGAGKCADFSFFEYEGVEVVL